MSEQGRPGKGFAHSFANAFRGLTLLFRTQRNARNHAACALAALALGGALRIEPIEWIAILLCISLVLAAESANSALERLADRLEPDPDPLIRDAKDLAAGAVLIAALIAALVGALVFLPKILKLLTDGTR